MKSQLASLLKQNWYINPALKASILEREASGKYTEAKIAQLAGIIQRMNDMQEELVKKIVAADPLFFAEFDHELQAEAFEKIKSLEDPEHEAELNAIESELEAFLGES